MSIRFIGICANVLQLTRLCGLPASASTILQVMTTRIRDLIEALDLRAPFDAAAGWDSVGLQIGRSGAAVDRIAVVHEITDTTVAKCVAASVDTVVTYHPLVFHPLTSVTDRPGAEGRALMLAEEGIAVVTMHTNWDVAEGGTADCLAGALGIDEVSGFGIGSDAVGEPEVGRIGAFDGSWETLLSGVIEVLGGVVRSAAVADTLANRVAVLPGSGGAFVAAAVALGADVLVTGDVSHHEARSAADGGMAIIDPGHASTERPGVQALYAAVVEIAGSVEDLTSIDNSPWEGG